MSIKLLVESGATKTDWVLIKDGLVHSRQQTQGLNPLIQSSDDIIKVIRTELHANIVNHDVEFIYYYGAGVQGKKQMDVLTNIMEEFWNPANIDIASDMLAAARGLAGKEKAVVAILGTGSNSTYYNGQQIESRIPSLGYLAGDDGSGNHIGKELLRHYAFKSLDQELTLAFENRFGSNIETIINNLYGSTFPNRYLATFVPIIKDLRGHYIIENILEDCFTAFFLNNLLKYRESWLYPIHFTGSVAYNFSDVIYKLGAQFQLEIGKIEASPLEGLIAYHGN